MNKTAEGHSLRDDVSNYDKNAYERPSVTVDNCICTIMDGELRVLLIKRKFPPFRDCWAIPGGFVDVKAKETLLETAERELEEETSLKNVHIEQFQTYGDPGRDPRMRIITVAFFALVPSDKLGKVEASDDAKEYGWFSLEKPPKLGFDHDRILRDLGKRLKEKIRNYPIAFSFVPKRFTWTELKSVYETILGKKIRDSNFRRDIMRIFSLEYTKHFGRLSTSGRRPRLLSYKGIKKTF